MANRDLKMTDLPSSLFPLPSSASPTEWEAYLAARQGHLLQSRAWGELKSRFGWSTRQIRAGDAAAQILFRHLPLGLTLAYIPKGPVGNWATAEQGHDLFAAIHAEAKKRRAIFLKIEPDGWSSKPALDSSLAKAATFLTEAGFIPADTIQPHTSLIVDLTGDEATLLAAMKQKTRYNIRLAEKKGVIVRRGSTADVPIFHQLARLTAARDGFGIHSPGYYQAAYELFAPDHCALLIAEFQAQPLAALMAFRQGAEAYYFYGASSNEQRNLMAPYLIQWEAMRWAKSMGCTRYDLWGIPDADPATLETEFEGRQDGLWGVYRFKRGFGGQWVRNVGAYDYVYNPLLYQLYRRRRKGLGL
jgi:peptidoglycan pentaglycine glycine transferase (the first glycine)